MGLRWNKWRPDIGENRELPEEDSLFFEIAAGITPQGMTDLAESLGRVTTFVPPAQSAARLEWEGYRNAIRSFYVESLTPFVRIVGGPHSVEGRPLNTLDDYFRLLLEQADMGNTVAAELINAVALFNTPGGKGH